MPDQVFQEIPDQVLQTLRYLREKDDGLIMQELPDTICSGLSLTDFGIVQPVEFEIICQIWISCAYVPYVWCV